MEVRNRKVYFKYSISVIWTLTIVTVCMVSASMVQIPGIDKIGGLDKLGHFGLYLIAALLWMNALQHTVAYGYAQMISFFGLVMVGVLVELMQANLTTDRHFEYYDILANVIGTLVGTSIHPSLAKRSIFSR